jgi:hypothetical protein
MHWDAMRAALPTMQKILGGQWSGDNEVSSDPTNIVMFTLYQLLMQYGQKETTAPLVRAIQAACKSKVWEQSDRDLRVQKLTVVGGVQQFADMLVYTRDFPRMHRHCKSSSKYPMNRTGDWLELVWLLLREMINSDTATAGQRKLGLLAKSLLEFLLVSVDVLLVAESKNIGFCARSPTAIALNMEQVLRFINADIDTHWANVMTSWTTGVIADHDKMLLYVERGRQMEFSSMEIEQMEARVRRFFVTSRMDTVQVTDIFDHSRFAWCALRYAAMTFIEDIEHGDQEAVANQLALMWKSGLRTPRKRGSILSPKEAKQHAFQGICRDAEELAQFQDELSQTQLDIVVMMKLLDDEAPCNVVVQGTAKQKSYDVQTQVLVMAILCALENLVRGDPTFDVKKLIDARWSLVVDYTIRVTVDADTIVPPECYDFLEFQYIAVRKLAAKIQNSMGLWYDRVMGESKPEDTKLIVSKDRVANICYYLMGNRGKRTVNEQALEKALKRANVDIVNQSTAEVEGDPYFLVVLREERERVRRASA